MPESGRHDQASGLAASILANLSQCQEGIVGEQYLVNVMYSFMYLFIYFYLGEGGLEDRRGGWISIIGFNVKRQQLRYCDGRLRD